MVYCDAQSDSRVQFQTRRAVTVGGKSAVGRKFGNPMWGHPSACQQVLSLKFLPVECHTDPYGIWGKGHVVFNDEGA